MAHHVRYGVRTRMNRLTLDRRKSVPFVLPQSRFDRRGVRAAVGLVGIATFLLGRQFPAPAQIGSTPSFHQLTFRRGIIQNARFTADGRTVVYSASWDGRPVELYAGSIDNPESRSLGWPTGALLSVSRTNEVAASLRCGEGGMGACGGGTFATGSLAGGTPRELASDVGFAEWTPAGEVVVVRRRAGRDRLEFPIGRVVHEDLSIVLPRVDPTGQRVAVVTASVPATPDTPMQIIVIDRDGTKRTL